MMMPAILCQLFIDLLLLSSFDQAVSIEGNPTQETGGHQEQGNYPSTSQTLTTRPATPTQINGDSDDEDARSYDNGDPTGTQTQSGYNLCAYYDDNPSTKNIELSKRFFKTNDGDAEGGDLEESMGLGVPVNNTVKCSDYCFTLWVADPRNKSKVIVSKQGCWLISEGQDCQPNLCVSNLPPRQNNTHFCCCSGRMCNTRFQDIYNPADHTTTTTTTTEASLLAVDLLHDGSYRKKTIAVALVSVVSVSLVIVFAYLTYRLCLTPKTTSPPSSSIARVEPDVDPMRPDFNVDDLKQEDMIVRGRYSEVRRGLLGSAEVAIKIYQPHHRQYYYNERNAFAQPFMDHENLVKFYGAKELEDPETNLLQYIIVTEYIPLGSLTSYLKHNTIDWYTLCQMCQGISRGLAHLHTDIQKGALFKPAIAHRDLNTRNILVKSDLTCVLADLGFSVGIMGSKIIKNGVAESAEQASLADVGTLRYMAPEVFGGAVNLRDCEASLKQIDIYALGLIIWEIASRCVDLYQGAPVPEYQLPFQAEGGTHPTFEEMQVLVVKYKTRPKFPEVWKDSNPAVRSLKETIEDCWDADAEARLTSLCVQERIMDMTALWVQGTKHRGVTPTLNATMNLPEGNSSGMVNSGSAVVSNGVTYLPSYIDSNNEVSEGVIDARQRSSPAVPDTTGHQAEEETMDSCDDGDEVMAPLITNVGHLASSGSADSSEGRVRSWLQDQSMSGSTLDTMLPPTPSMEEDGTLSDITHPPAQPTTHPPVKASNVMLAINKAVILHPNQGRNPTVERNTHKRSDEELTVSGNRLVGPGDQVVAGEGNTNRRGSLSTQSAPPNRSGEGSSFDGIDAVDSSSLVQNDSLNQHHIHTRNAPIPYLQNHVHGETVGGSSAVSHITRPKLANLSGNRSSYLRLHGEDGSPRTHTATIRVSDEAETKSLKHKLSKLIRPKDLGLKFSQMVFGGKGKRNQQSHNLTNSVDVEAGGNVNSNRNSGQYINSGLEASPANRNSSQINIAPVAPLNMEVQIVNGAVVTRAYGDLNTHNNLSQQNGSMVAGPQSRLSATNVMRLGVLADSSQEELPSPSLFPRSGEINSAANDESYLSSSLAQENAVPLHNLVITKSTKDYGSMHPVVMNQAYGLDANADTSTTDLHTPVLADDNINEVADPMTDFKPVGAATSSTEIDPASSGLCQSYPSGSSVSQTWSDSKGSMNALSKLSLVGCGDSRTSTSIQSPQNKTISPLNKSTGLSLQATSNLSGKKFSQDLPQASSSSPNSVSSDALNFHFPDTKGGNSIMHNIYIDEQSLSREQHPGRMSRHSSHSGSWQVKKSGKKSGIKSQSREDTSSISGPSGVLPETKGPKSSKKLSQSQSATDLTQKDHRLSESYNTVNCSGGQKSDEEKFGYKMDVNKQLAFANRHRPQSLSLKGHNYSRRGRSVSSSSSSSSSSLPCPSQPEAGSIASTTAKAVVNGTVKRDENGPLTLVVPNVTLDKSSPLFQVSNRKASGGLPTTAPSVAVTSVRGSSSSSSSGNSSVTNNHVNVVVKNSATTCASGGSGSSGASSTANSSHNSSKNSLNSVVSDNSACSSNASNASKKKALALKDRSDSSEKIRRRIKTPVSFKKGRLSLYDDRLMTQSLGGVLPSSESGGDSNNNNEAGCCSASGVVDTWRRQGGQAERSDGTGGITSVDYHKMIKSDSDLVV